FYLFPVEFAVTQAMEEAGFGVGIVRVVGFATAGAAMYYLMMARYGIRGILDLRAPWRLVCFFLTIFVSLLGGFRSLLITFMIHFAAQFYLERLVRTRLCAVLVLSGIVGGALLFPFVNKMPMSVQRCVAFLPGVEVSPICKADAENSTRWRVEMWSILLPEVPKYLILGKGYALNPADLYLTSQAELRGLAKNYEVASLAGSYHNGPLSVIIPFGIFGAIGFLWFLWAGIWALYRNYRYGDPGLQAANTFLLAYFLMRVIVFLFIFGGINSELFKFTGILGLSVAMNRGVRKPAEVTEPELVGVSAQPAAA
ncbi:MAG TPA: O-antigen ligase family protein, partial [Verrucomicrobiae bacterium]|nr:O-antigen ligase family protein [Verrucomicrobiae bacterium]